MSTWSSLRRPFLYVVFASALGFGSLAATACDGSGGEGGSGEGAGGCVAVFDGVDDGLLIEADELELTDQFSVSVFAKPEPLADGGIAFLAGLHVDGGSNGFYLALTNDGGARNARFNVFPGDSTCAPSAALPEGEDVHLLGSYDGTTARLFIQGALAASEACGAPNIDSLATFTIGRSSTNLYPFAGELDDVAYYGYALVEDFDAAELGCTNAKFRVDFDDITGVRVLDACGSSNGAAYGVDPVDPVETQPEIVCP